ncbi:hypothetical protein AB0I39_30375 [Kitasatospora purpeofusca]|uniref:hypothetical protein n=1 Tax=Kitasatospora purpeofusca TaxID=67352 RepID=UPI0033F2EFE5
MIRCSASRAVRGGRWSIRGAGRRVVAHLQQVTGARDRSGLVADHAWAGHLTARHLGAQGPEAVRALPADKRLLLRLTAAGTDNRAAGTGRSAPAGRRCVSAARPS